MTKTQRSDQTGDSKAPPLKPTEAGLRTGADQAAKILASQSSVAARPSILGSVGAALKADNVQNGAPTSCKQLLWFSFFFDGTGNNREADLTLSKHSNIVRLYRAHQPTSPKRGIFPIYIPGVGTYFPEIGDDGGGQLGLGCGAMGEERLEFALDQFDKLLEKPLARANAPQSSIQEVNIAVFGFSRGAALARAFLNMVMENRCVLRDGRWVLTKGSYPVRFRFLGLFDTVASVGLPMSWNNTALMEAKSGDTAGIIKMRLKDHKNTSPDELAFFSSTNLIADPSPGDQHGHRGWGARLKVHEKVEEVRHFVAAHEVRNSFPVDSVSILEGGHISRPANFFEIVYPGAHSDVGGGYAPGEGGRGITPSENLSLVPLRHMYDFAKRHGVPMLAEWTEENNSDFKVHPDLSEAYDHYVKAIGSFNSLGEGINKHMQLYYAWRFKAIRKKASGDKSEAMLIKTEASKFQKHNEALSKQVDHLVARENVALLSLNALKAAQEIHEEAADDSVAQRVLSVKSADIEKASEKYDSVHDERLRAKARNDALPNMKNFQEMLDLYDRQLLSDVHAIRTALRGSSANKKYNKLRPHYKVLLEAYENEFERNNGLKDEKIVKFFDNYVHDSLAGFAKDATLPSDPRVVYLGGNEKYRYASLDATGSPSKAETRLA